jgi:hypothetical protein
MDTQEAARHLGVSKRTMQRYIDAYWKQDDRTKGFVVTKLHVNRGHGYEWRIHFPGDDSGDTPADTPADTTPPHTDVPDALAVPDASRASTAPLVGTRAIDVPDPDVHRALAAALRDALAANRAWAHRYDALAAEVESLRRPWWRKVWEKVGRREP